MPTVLHSWYLQESSFIYTLVFRSLFLVRNNSVSVELCMTGVVKVTVPYHLGNYLDMKTQLQQACTGGGGGKNRDMDNRSL